MEQRIKSERLLQIWKSVREKVKSIDASIIGNVEKDLNEKNVESFPRGTNLLETIDFLHESLQSNSTDLLPKVFDAYQAFCIAILIQEKEREIKLSSILNECQIKVLNLKLPISKNIPALQETINIFKKCTGALIKSSEKLKASEKSRQLLLAEQINISLNLLIRAVAEFEIEDKTSGKRTQSGIEYVLGRLLWCSKDLNLDDASECGQFLDVMDKVLDFLEDYDSKPIDMARLRNTCEVLLSHAMSVAHVALDDDSQDIFYIGQKVLSRVESLKKEESPGLMSLQLGALADVLQQLEQTVNNALLKLVLEVFLDIDGSISNLVAGERDLDTRISAFDLYVDRVMQIGLFAVACSNDIKRVSSVRSCLASLESLEPDFVPSIQAISSGNGSAELVKFFENHWKEEARRLETLLDQLIDPAAFAQIVASRVALMQSSSAQAPRLVQCASKLRSLISHLDADDLDLSSELIKKFDYYLAELKAALDQPLCDKWERRVIERARLLSKSVQVIAQELADHTEFFETYKSKTPARSSANVIPTEDGIIPQEGQTQTPQGSNISFPESVADLPIDLTENIKGTNMEPFFLAGRKINLERNLLYKTPQQAKTPLSILRKTPGNIISHTPSSVAKQLFPQPDEDSSHDLDSTMELNVTNILDNLTGLDDTMSLFVGLEDTMGTALEGFKRRRYKIGASVRSRKTFAAVKSPKSMDSVTPISPSLGSQGVSINERQDDLSFLQKKIEELKFDLETFGKTIDSCQQEISL